MNLKFWLITASILLFAISLFNFPIVSACSSPVFRNQFGVPVSLFGTGVLQINTVPFLDTLQDGRIQFPVSIDNTDDQSVTVTLTPDPSFSSFFPPVNLTLEPSEKKSFTIAIRADAGSKSGVVQFTGRCADGLPTVEGVVNVIITSPQELNNATCPSSQFDSFCRGGYLIKTFCSPSQPLKEISSTCTTTCCNQIGGKCVKGVCKVSLPSYTLKLDVNDGKGKSKNVLVYVLLPGSSQALNISSISGKKDISSPNSTVDLKMEIDNSTFAFVLRNVNITKLIGNTTDIVVDSAPANISSVTVLKTYKVKLPVGFPFLGAMLTFNYSNLNVSNPQNLVIYKCSNYDIVNNICNDVWKVLNTQINTTAKTASVDIVSFSAYSLAEKQPEPQPTPTPQQSSSSGSAGDGGGGGAAGGGGGAAGGGAPTSQKTTTTTTTPPPVTETTTTTSETTTVTQTVNETKESPQTTSTFSSLLNRTNLSIISLVIIIFLGYAGLKLVKGKGSYPKYRWSRHAGARIAYRTSFKKTKKKEKFRLILE